MEINRAEKLCEYAENGSSNSWTIWTRIRGIHAEREALEKLKVKNYRKKK